MASWMSASAAVGYSLMVSPVAGLITAYLPMCLISSIISPERQPFTYSASPLPIRAGGFTAPTFVCRCASQRQCIGLMLWIPPAWAGAEPVDKDLTDDHPAHGPAPSVFCGLNSGHLSSSPLAVPR